MFAVSHPLLLICKTTIHDMNRFTSSEDSIVKLVILIMNNGPLMKAWDKMFVLTIEIFVSFQCFTHLKRSMVNGLSIARKYIKKDRKYKKIKYKKKINRIVIRPLRWLLQKFPVKPFMDYSKYKLFFLKNIYIFILFRTLRVN